MDWIRRMLGYQYRYGDDDNPFGSPTWKEIVKEKNSKNTQDSRDLEPPSGDFFPSGGPGDEMFFPHQDIFGPIEDMFGPIDDMFSQLESLMQDMHRHPAWTVPGSLAETDPQTPRDSMLKMPDSDPAAAVPPPDPPYPPHYRHEVEKGDSQSGQDDMSHLTAPFFINPHHLFDRIFESFGNYRGESPFPGHLPEYGPDSGDHSRESLMKKKDSDIDDRVSDDLSKLPEGGPGYSRDSPQNSTPLRSPWNHPESSASPHTGVRQKFYSQSIVTIRKPDGSIEETKKYSDSTGREEVTVTHKQPQDASPGQEYPQPGGPMDHTSPSIFSWFFRK